MSRQFQSFVGRDDELGALDAALDEAREGRGGVWLLTGAAGIGKSRLADEAARHARGAGFLVAWGRCWEAGGAPAFWPWIQALRTLLRGQAGDALSPSQREQLGPLVPELAVEGATSATGATSEARFQLLDAMTSALCALAAGHPLFIILDDLHAADQSSLALLDFASRQLHGSPVLVLGTFRSHEAQHTEHAALLARVAQNARTIPLGPLDASSLERYLVDTAGPAGASLAPALHDRTEGNPLFMVELVRLIASAPGITAETLEQTNLPPGLEQALRVHADALAPPARAVMEMAAIMGREFGSAALSRYFGVGFDEVRAALGDAVGLGLLQPLPDDRHRFAHVLIRDVLERDLGDAARRELHRILADALAGSDAGGDVAWSEIAHHYELAGPACHRQAVDALARAGDAAAASLAFEDAAQTYQRALQLLARSGDDDRRQRAVVLIGLCRARVGAGARDQGRESCRAAAALARELDDAELLARAALELGSILVFGTVDPELVALLREALDALPAGDSGVRALVQARLAAALQPAQDSAVPIQLAVDAIAMARRVGDEATLLAVLRTGCSAMVDLAQPEVRLELDREHARLAAAAGQRQDALRAQLRLVFDCFELGDRLGADAAVRAATDLISEIDHRSVAWRLPAMNAMRALWDGALEAALASCERAVELGERSGDPNARSTLLYQRARILRMLGRTDQLLASLADLEGLFRGTPTMERYMRVVVAAHRLEAGDRDGALRAIDSEELHRVMSLGDRAILEAVSELAFATADRSLAAVIRDRLASSPDGFVGGGVLGMTWDSPVRRLLALCARTLGEHEHAIAHYQAAIVQARRLGGEPIAVRVQVELGELLASMGRDDEARSLFTASVDEATSLAMPQLAARARADLAELPEVGGGGAAAESFSLEPEGDVWCVRHGELEFRVKDSLGVRFLALLIEQPGRELHVLDMVAPERRQELDGDGGEMLDEAARAAYKQRIAELRSQLERAEEWNDPGRAAAARAELDALVEELSRGLGLGGRGRRFGGNAERARVNVQRRIRDAIRRIKEHDEPLALHLERSIRTGMHCSYAPT